MREAWASPGPQSSGAAASTRAYVANDMIMTDVDDHRDHAADAANLGMSLEDYCQALGIDPAEALRSSSAQKGQERSASRDSPERGHAQVWPSERSDSSLHLPRSASHDRSDSFGQPSLTRAKENPSTSLSSFSNLVGSSHYGRDMGQKGAASSGQTGAASSGVHSHGLSSGGLGMGHATHEGPPRQNRRASQTMGMSSDDLKKQASSYAKDMGLGQGSLAKPQRGPQERRGSKERHGKDSYHPMEDEMLLFLRQREEQQREKDKERERLRLALADPTSRHILLQKSGIRINVKNITNEVVSESGKTTIGLSDRMLGPFLVLKEENVYDLKIRIYDEMGWAPKHQKLIANALELPDEWVIGRDAKLQDGSTVLLRHVTEVSVNVGCDFKGCCVS